VMLLLTHNVNANSIVHHYFPHTALDFASTDRIQQKLILFGVNSAVDPYHKPFHSLLPLYCHLLMHQKNQDLVKEIESNKSTINQLDDNGNALLTYAATRAQGEIVAACIANGAPL